VSVFEDSETLRRHGDVEHASAKTVAAEPGVAEVGFATWLKLKGPVDARPNAENARNNRLNTAAA
jgi:hypothetical protein